MDPRPDAAAPEPVSTSAAPDEEALTVTADPDSPATPEGAIPAAPGRSRARWLIGGGIAVAAVAALALGATLLGARPLPEALRYVPTDSAVVVELRPELPGDQRQHLGNFLAHFPGFDDQSILDLKIDESLDRLIGESSGGAVDYATQVKPLLEGPMALSMSTDGLRDMASGDSPGGFLVVATTEGDVTCDAVFGSTTAGETHRGVDVTVVDGSRVLSCSVHDRFVLIGSADAIRAAIDARLDGEGIDRNETYRTAREALEGDQLATIFADGEALSAVIEDAYQGLGQANPAAGLVSEWIIAGVRVVDDALVLDAHGPAVEQTLASGAPTFAQAGKSRFAEILPAGTLGYLEVHGIGALLEEGLASMRADPAQAEALEALEAGLAMVGGTENLISWMEELGVAVLPAGDTIGGAILIRGTDAKAAEGRVTQIRNLLVLAAIGTDITLRDADHGGVTITTVDLGDVSALLEGLGGLDGPGSAGDARLEFSFAVRDELVVIAYGEGVVERILDSEAGSSLASTPTYKRAVELAGATNDLQVYVALDAIVASAGQFLPADAFATWNADIKPYLEHLAGAAWASTNVATTNRSRFVLTVK